MCLKFILTVSIIFGIFWAYWPSLEHIPKQDHVFYLKSLAGKDDFVSLVFGSYSFPRDAYPGIGDVLLFRPLTHCFLGLEQYLFGYNFRLWQLTGVILHLTVIVSLGCFLWTIQPGTATILLTGFFSLLLVNTQMVDWNQINPYMIFSVLLIWALREMYLLGQSQGTRSGHVIRTMILMSFASLFYEGGVFFSILMLFFVWYLTRREKPQQAIILMLLPAVIFITLNLWDISSRPFVLNYESGLILKKGFSVETLTNILRTFKWFLTGGIYLVPSAILEDVRTIIYPHTLSWPWPFFRLYPEVIRGNALLLTTLVILKIGFNKEHVKRVFPFLLLVAGIILTYVSIIVVGRINPRGYINGLLVNGYYFYIFWVGLLIFLYTIIDFNQCRLHPLWKLFRLLGFVLIIVITAVNATSVHAMNRMIAEKQKDQRRLLSYVAAFVKEHKEEAGFSFYISSDCPGSLPEWVPKDKTMGIGFADIYYKRYIDRAHPQYQLPCPS